MAIDTRNKRASAIDIESPWRDSLPLADGAIGQADRQHAAFLYSGILADAPVVAATIYLPRLDIYGSRAAKRLDIFGSAASTRLDVYGSDAAKRLDIFGGDGSEN